MLSVRGAERCLEGWRKQVGTTAGASHLPERTAWRERTLGLTQQCQCTGVAFGDLAETVCPSDPPGAERLLCAKAFFLVLAKQGWIWELGVLVVELLIFFAGLAPALSRSYGPLSLRSESPVS